MCNHCTLTCDSLTDADRAQHLADAHWTYIARLMYAHDEDEEIMELCGFHYRTAFIHGYKHALEDTDVA